MVAHAILFVVLPLVVAWLAGVTAYLPPYSSLLTRKPEPEIDPKTAIEVACSLGFAVKNPPPPLQGHFRADEAIARRLARAVQAVATRGDPATGTGPAHERIEVARAAHGDQLAERGELAGSDSGREWVVASGAPYSAATLSAPSRGVGGASPNLFLK